MTDIATKPLHDVRFPNEPAGYREARDELLQAEMELRRRTEQVAALRRTLPLGGDAAQDYAFEEGGASLDDDQSVRTVRLSELFGDKDTLIAYSFMYGPEMAEACPLCTSMLDGMNGQAQHVNQRASLVIVAKSPIQRIRAYARSRGWSGLRLLSSASSSYNLDYHGETGAGDQTPALNLFVRRDGRIRHFWCSEMMFGPRAPGQDPRHVDMIWPLWNLLDLTPQGRAGDWYPQRSY